MPFLGAPPHRLKEVFELLEEIVPSGKLQLLLSLQQAFPAEGDEVHLTELQTCATCGDPSTQPVCALCHLREFLDA